MLNVKHENFIAAFPALVNTLGVSAPLVTLYGEGYGAGIQKGDSLIFAIKILGAATLMSEMRA